MCTTSEQLELSRERLRGLKERVAESVADPDKARRVKDMELAGIRGMIERLQAEIQELRVQTVSQRISELRLVLGTSDPQAVTKVVGGTLDLVESLVTEQA